VARLRRFVFVLTCILLVGGGGAARADVADYDTLIDEAVSEYNRNHFTEAFALFEQAHAVEANARTLRGMGLCAYELRHYVQAVMLLQAAQAEQRKALDAEQSRQVAAFLAKARRFIAEITLQSEPPDAEVHVDGARVSTHKFMLDAGDHALLLSAPGYHSDGWTLPVSGGQTITVQRQLTRIEVSPAQVAQAGGTDSRAGAPADAQAAAQDSGGLLSRWWFWTIVGVVAAGATAGVLVAAHAGSGTDAGSSGVLLHGP
jgi:tetratricopeptide (TPR) repeat protein